MRNPLRRSLVAGVGVLLVMSGTPVAGATAARTTPTVSLTVDPRYPVIGHTARLAVRVTGTHGAATGWVRIRFQGVVIADCRHLVLRAGKATCTAPATFRSERTFLVGYKGNATYAPRVITRHVWS